MADTVKADIPQLRVVSDRFDVLAEQLSTIDTSTIAADAAHCFPAGSSASAALDAAELATRRALLVLADRAWSLHDTLNRVCDDYTRTDAHLASELGKVVPA